MAFIAPIVGLIGTAVSAFGTIAGANAQSAGLEYQAKVARAKEVQEKATAQRSQLETTRKTQLAESQLQARAAASGAGASDPTVVDLASDISGRGAYQGLLQMWQGQERGWDYETDARAKDAQAANTRAAAPLSAFGTLLGGAGSMFKAYGKGSFGGLGTSNYAYSTDDETWPNNGWMNG